MPPSLATSRKLPRALIACLFLAAAPMAFPGPGRGLRVSQGKPTTASESAAPAKLRRVAQDLALAEAMERPWTALLLGDFEFSRRVLGDPPPSAAAWTDALRDVQVRLRRITRADLTSSERTRAESLTGWIRALRNLEESHAARRADPLRITREVERVLNSLLGVETFPLLQRLALLEAYVARLPERWNRGREGLTTPVRAWAQEAAEEIQLIEQILRVDLPAAAESAELGERSLARLKRKLVEAADATAEFRRWLIEGPAATGRPRRELGKRTYENVVGSLTGRERSALDLRAELLAIIARDDPGRLAPWEANPNMAQVSARITSSMERGLKASEQLYAKQGLARLGPAPKVRTGLIPGGAVPGDLVRLARSPQGDYMLLFEAPNPTWSGELRRGLAGLSAPLTLSAEGLRRGASGEALLRSAHARLPADARMPFLLEPFVEGFGLFVIDATARLAFPRGGSSADLLVKGGARLRLFEAARLLAALELHADQLKEGEVIDGFRMRTGVSIEIARAEVSRIWHEPLLGSPILGYIEFRTMEDTLAQAMPRSDAILRTLALAVAAPGVRPGDLLEEFRRSQEAEDD